MGRVLASLAVIALAVWAVSCATNPVTGKKDFMLLSEADELAMGKETDPIPTDPFSSRRRASSRA